MTDTTVATIHGFNVSDGGAASVDRWVNPLRRHGIRVLADELDYGWQGLLGARWSDEKVAKRLAHLAKMNPGLSVIAHSHGCNIAHQAVQEHGAELRHLFLVNPALRRSAVFNENAEHVWCMHAESDVVVTSSLALRWLPWNWFMPHPWGEAGRYGLTRTGDARRNVDLENFAPEGVVVGHNGAFRHRAILERCVLFIVRTLRHQPK